MNKFIIILLSTIIILFSGCTGQNPAKSGDNVSVDYIGSLTDGKIFDTSIESVAKKNDMFIKGRTYEPLYFTIGKGEVIEGFEQGIIGMKVGETKTITIPPEKGYPINPNLIQTYPLIQDEPAKIEFPKKNEVSLLQFEQAFGKDRKVGDMVTYPRTNINLSIQNMTSSNVTLVYNLKVGDNIEAQDSPWNQTVIKVDDVNVTIKPDVKKGENIQFPNVPWTSTVIDMDNETIIFKHNPIPDTTIQTRSGEVRISFNETSIIMDRNMELAGKTLKFEITLKSINK